MVQSIPQLFISYAHTDNQKIEGALLGWVDRFYEGLEMELKELGLDFNFWRDKRDLDKDGFFDDKILGAVADSRVLVAVVSPVYPKRPYCLKELQHFVENSEDGLPSSVERVIKVVKQPLEDEDARRLLPDYLDGLLDFHFYSIDRQDNRIVRYIRRDGEIANNEFWDTIFDLARTIRKHLAEGRYVDQQAQSETTVYLAETSSDEDASFRTVRAELMAKGVHILPSKALPLREDQAIEAIDADLRNADFSVHLLGERAGYVPEGETNTPIVRLQMERAAMQADARTDFRRLIWGRPQMQPAEGIQRKLVEGLSDGTLLHPRDEFVRETLELFKNTLLHAVSTEPQVSAADAGQPRTIFLVYDRADAEQGAAIRSALFDLGFEVFRPDYSGEQEAADQAFKTCASQAEGAIVLYGNTHEAWVQQTLMRLSNWKALGRHGPLGASAVLLTGEPSPVKSDFRTRLTDLTLDATAAPLDEELLRFIDKLKS
jgi:hypothetical protein